MNKKLDSFFKISERGSNIKTEIIAGLTTFFAMAYIVVTNPNQVVGFVFGGPFDTIWNSVYVASILVAVIGTLLYALYAKLPFAQACGMGLNSFFFVSFIIPNMLDPIKGYNEGLCIILLSGVIFLVLSITGLRKYIATSLPDCLKKAIPAGIGLFIAFIGFKNVGIIQANQYTFVQFFDFHGAIKGQSFGDAWKAIAPVVLAILGFLAIAVLDKKKVKGSVIIAIGGVTVLYYLTTWTLPSFDFGKIGQSFADFGKYGFLGAFKGFGIFSGGFSNIINAVVLVITFTLVDMFDTIGTLYGTASQADMLDENGDPIDIDKSMTSDSVATLSGAVLGTSTCTTFVESAAGVAAGGNRSCIPRNRRMLLPLPLPDSSRSYRSRVCNRSRTYLRWCSYAQELRKGRYVRHYRGCSRIPGSHYDASYLLDLQRYRYRRYLLRSYHPCYRQVH